MTAVLLLLAGCLTASEDSGEGGPAAQQAEPLVVEYDGECSAVLLIQLVDYAQTDQYLPPGFHPRDPQDFLSFIPVALGQAGVLMLFVECQQGTEAPVGYASLGIFVEPPFVAGYEPGLFDFYEVDRYGATDPYRGALRLAGWPEHDADVALAIGATVGGNPEQPSDAQAAATDPEGVVASIDGLGLSDVGVGNGAVRWWHDSREGLGVLEFNTDLRALVGAGRCEARAGTAFADFLGGTNCLSSSAETIVAVFPGFSIDSSARFLPGVHAE